MSSHGNKVSRINELVKHIVAFLNHRQSIDALWASVSSDLLEGIASIDNTILSSIEGPSDDAFDPEMRQMTLNDDLSIQPVTSLRELYEAATAARPIFERVVRDNVISQIPRLASDRVDIIDLKGRDRAAQKVLEDYNMRSSGPTEAWLFDIVRGSIECDDQEQIIAVVRAIESQPEFRIVSVQNRFKNPTAAGFRDIIIKVRVSIPFATYGVPILVPHTCELQIHHKIMKIFATENQSYSHYKYFRGYFSGRSEIVNDRLALFRTIGEFDATGLQAEEMFAKIMESAIDMGDTVRLESLHRLLFGANEHVLAERMARCLIDLPLSQSPPYSVSQYFIINDLISSLQHQMRAGEALGLCERMLTVLSGVNDISLQQKNYLTAMAELHVSQVQNVVGKFQDALQHAQIGLTAITLVRGRYGMQYAFAVNSVAELLVALGQNAEALPLFNEAGYIRTIEVGDWHELTIQSLYNLANCCYLDQQYDQARVIAEQALNLRRKVLGDDHRDTLMAMALMAIIQSQLGQRTEALMLMETTVAMLTATVGEEHTDTISAMNGLGHLYCLAGQPQKALEHLTRVFRIALRVFGPGHFLVATYASNIGVIYVREAQFVDGLPYFQQALDMRLQSLGPTHVCTGQAYNCLGVCQVHLGQLDDGALSLEKGLAINSKSGTSVDLATTLNSLGVLNLKLGRPVEALAFAKEAYVRFAQALGPLDIAAALSLKNLGNVYRDLGAVNQALVCLNQACTLITQIHGKNHINTIEVNGNLGIAMLFHPDSDVNVQGRAILTAAVTSLRNAELPADHPFVVKFVGALKPQFVDDSKSRQLNYNGVVKDGDPVVPSSLTELGILDLLSSPPSDMASIAPFDDATLPPSKRTKVDFREAITGGYMDNPQEIISPLGVDANETSDSMLGQTIVRIGEMDCPGTSGGGSDGIDTGVVSDVVSDVDTDVVTDAVTELVTDVVAGFVTDVVVTDVVTGVDTDVVTGVDTDVVTGVDTDAVTGVDTDVVTGADTDDVTDVVSGVTTDVVTGVDTDVVAGVDTDDVTDVVTGVATDVVAGVDADAVTGVDNGVHTCNANEYS